MNNRKSKIQNPKLPRRPRRRGISILEVLFAVMITTVGLFSAIAIFPFASAQARRARINEMMAAAGRSAFHDFDTRGMRRPDRWLAWDQINSLFVPFNPGGGSPANLQLAESLCIDPRMIAAHTTYVSGIPKLLPGASSSGSFGGQCVQYFPYQEPFADANNTCTYDQSGDQALQDLNGNGVHDPQTYATPNNGTYLFDSTLMRRITLWSGITNSAGQKLPMTLQQANAIFRIDDDLAYQRPEDDKSKPATQDALLQPGGTANQWLRRQAEGKIGWIATLVPKFDISGLPSDQYILSVVMIYDRPNDLDVLDNKKERVVPGQWQSIGASTGGEIRLVANDPEQLKLRPNDWVMVSGSRNLSGTAAGPIITRFGWYRVSDCENEPTLISSSPDTYELYVTLMGQDWNQSFTVPATTPAAPMGLNVRVTVVEGAFAVYEKTIRLEYGSTF